MTAIGLAIATGFGLGLFSFASDYVLRYPWSMIGNVAGPWVLAAFGVGAFASARSTRRGAAAGLLALVTATVVYYISTSFEWPSSEVRLLVPGVAVWGLVAVIAGPAAGSAGAVWRNGSLLGRRRWWVRAAAVGGLGATLLAEALVLALETSDPDTWAGAGVELLVAAAIPIVLLRSSRDRWTAYAAVLLLGGAVVPLLAFAVPHIYRLAGGHW